MQCIINMHCIIFLYNSVSKWDTVISTQSTEYLKSYAGNLSKYKMICITTASADFRRPLASTVMPIDHFIKFCTSETKCAQCSFALEPTNYQASAYYSNSYIYAKSRTNYDMSYVFAF